LQSGDTLVLYTDGITDLLDEDGEFYGDERFLAALKRLAGKQPTELVDALMDELGKFRGKAAQADDVTVVAVMWRTEAG
jgi:sigma-B regulation protein RsbU (phosphoserine phosphatase)